MTGQRFITLGAVNRSIAFSDCDGVIAGMQTIFNGWGITESSSVNLAATVVKTKQGWSWTEHDTYKPRHWDSHPPQTELRVLTDVHEAALHWYLNANPELLCIHGAAVRMGKSLILFPARGRSGKSVLAAHLAFLGHDIFGDDVLAIKNGEGLAMGFLPRLRTPLPATISKSVKLYIDHHQGPAGGGWQYLKARQGKAVRLGEIAPLNALVLLRREENADANLSEARTADVLKAIVSENIIRTRPLLDIFDELHALCVDIPKYWLTFSDPLKAAKLLEDQFASHG
jgi:hypothetical protein